MTKPMSKMLLYVGIFFIIVFGWYGVKKLVFMWFMAHYEPPAVTVAATKSSQQTWQTYMNAIGTLAAMHGVDISTEVPGIIQEIRFNSGQHIHKGDIIIVLRSQVEQAKHKSAEAKLVLAKINYEREKTLFNKKVSPAATLDTRYAELLEAQAELESIAAEIQQKTIAAPFDGRLGIAMVNVGEYVSPGKTMVTLQALDPLFVKFNVPEQYLSKLYIGQSVDVTVNLQGGKLVHGKITALNAKVSPETRNILVEAIIPNPTTQLYPGMYGQVKLWFNTRNHTIVVPQTAISYSLSGDYVFLLKNDHSSKGTPHYHALKQNVKIGERRTNEVAIIDGLKPGDMIVTSGQLKLQNGASVLIDNNIAM